MLQSGGRSSLTKGSLHAPLPLTNQIRIMGKITISQKGNRTFYRVNRRIVCYRDGHKYCVGKPSSGSTHIELDALSENIAHERCIEICENSIYVEMKYLNPVAYNAHRVLNALA
nr:MAG TPA: hypothetical protein [Caudoviricetes sp.]